jgi:hypothetical protein
LGLLEGKLAMTTEKKAASGDARRFDAGPSWLLAALRSGDRATALEVSLETYFGPPRFPPPPGLPSALAALFTRFTPGLIRQNHLVLPGAGRVFYVENQGNCEWALRGDEEDPQVVRDGEFVEAERLSGFAIQLVLLEASMGAFEHGASACLNDSQRSRVLALFEEVPLGRWTWPANPTGFYVGPSAVAHVHETAPDEAWIFVSARTPADLRQLRMVDGVEWI